MQILQGLGMRVSEDLIPAQEQNPYGAFEDREIFKIQRELLLSVSTLTIPPGGDWQSAPEVGRAVRDLGAIVEKSIGEAESIWGFKDPRTAYLIPMWNRIFNRLNVVPKYVLAVRSPASVIASMRRQYNTDKAIAEMFWLSKYTEALHQTGLNLFILNYEDLFSDRRHDLVRALAGFCNLDAANADVVLDQTVKRNLDRASMDEVTINNHYVTMLHEALATSSGDQFDRDALSSVVREARTAMTEFEGWAIEARRLHGDISRIRRKPDQANERPRVPPPEVVEKSSEEQSLLAELLACRDETTELRIQLSDAANQIKAERASAKAKVSPGSNKNELNLRKTYSFQIGNAIVVALQRPGVNTLLMPFRVVRLLFRAMTGKRPQ